MNILIVHDRVDVAEAIEQIVELAEVDDCEVVLVADYHEARKMLQDRIFDLLILDLTIPFSSSGGEASYEYVRLLLEELFTMDTLNPPGDVIGITKDATALDLIDTAIGPHLMVSIEEDEAGRWKKYLKDRILYAARSAETRYISKNRHYFYDALIVTAMDKEMRPYSDHFEMSAIKHFEGAKEFLFTDKSGTLRKGVAFSIGRSGQPSAASLTQALVTFFRPRLALMTGYCGGVKGKVELGDLIFFEAVYAWDYGKWIEEGDPTKSVFKSRPNPISIDNQKSHLAARDFLMSGFNRVPALIDKLSQLSLGKLKKFDMYLSPVASGSAVVANDAIVSQIRGLNEAIWAVDMEAYGFYHAAANTRVTKPQYLCIKAVSDFCNGEKDDDYHPACSNLSAAAAVELLTKQWVFS